jgi:hypothetical protein
MGRPDVYAWLNVTRQIGEFAAGAPLIVTTSAPHISVCAPWPLDTVTDEPVPITDTDGLCVFSVSRCRVMTFASGSGTEDARVAVRAVVLEVDDRRRERRRCDGRRAGRQDRGRQRHGAAARASCVKAIAYLQPAVSPLTEITQLALRVPTSSTSFWRPRAQACRSRRGCPR